MSITIDSFLAMLQEKNELSVYDHSVAVSEGTACATVRKNGEKYIAVSGKSASRFSGAEWSGLKLCPLSVENAEELHVLFPYTRPCSHASHPFTIGLGDRLGLASPGHIRAISDFDVFPILAQQSIRELTLTNRTFLEVIAAATFGVFQEGYTGGYGADGDHLKTKEEIRYAIESGCTMITLDCSEHIDVIAATYGDTETNDAYAALPEDMRNHYESTYINQELPIIGSIALQDLKRAVLVFWRAILHAEECYTYIRKLKNTGIDFEMSIDETLTITTPAEHFIIARELLSHGVRPVSLAPHFFGAFEKGIDYIGNLDDFARDFIIHKKIADYFGYKLSVHSGSDKFSIFSTVGHVTNCHVHVKTAGTNWLEAVRIVAFRDPCLYRKMHKFAIEHRPEAEKYYHVSTKPEEISNIDLQNDAYLPEYLHLPASRQTLHIAYGLLLNEKWFADEFFRFMSAHEEEYYAGLVTHIGHHLQYLTAEHTTNN